MEISFFGMRDIIMANEFPGEENPEKVAYGRLIQTFN